MISLPGAPDIMYPADDLDRGFIVARIKQNQQAFFQQLVGELDGRDFFQQLGRDKLSVYHQANCYRLRLFQRSVLHSPPPDLSLTF